MSDHPGGVAASRTARVLEPSFVANLEALPLDELRRRRDEALAEREFQSYLRRLIQFRQDVLEDERQRRSTGDQPPPLVERLTEVLSEGPKGTSRGEALRVVLPEEDVEEADRRASTVLGPLGDTDPAVLDEDELARALERLSEEERVASSNRQAVLRVHDRLQDELKRRYREDPSQALR